MNGAKAFFKSIAGKSGADGGPTMSNYSQTEGKSKYGMGIGNTMNGSGGMADVSGSNGYLGSWGDDRFTNIAISVRIFQVICMFSMLIACIVLATFQNQWIGKLSGLTALLLIVTILSFLMGMFLLLVSFMPHSLHITQDKIIRVFEQPRLGLVTNGTGLGVWLIVAMTQTISAYTSAGCKDPNKDPHVNDSKGKKDDFIAALPSFCTTKKAGAAFAWFIFLTCVATMLLFLRFWRSSRKNGPRIPPFTRPGNDGAFQPLGDDMEQDADENIYAREHARYGDGGDGRYGYAPSAGHASGGGYDDQNAYQQYAQHTYGQGHSNAGGHSAYASGQNDPFADQRNYRQSYDYGAYNVSNANVNDPYAAIQQQLRSDRAPQLPPLYRG